MTKGQVLQEFFSGFDMMAYPAHAVPDDVPFPFLTYTPVFDSWSGGEVSITTNLWFHTESEAIPNAKAQELSEAIGLGGIFLRCDGGLIWLKRGTPWCQSLSDETDKNIKRRYLNVTAEFFTSN